MTTIFNDPAEFCDDQLDGFVDLYSDRLRKVAGGVVRLPQGEPEVAVIVGGGSGHYPAFAGLVGPGFAAGAVVGNIFTSPSAAQVYSVAKAAHRGRGVILTFGNYAGDNMNFGIAAKRLNDEGIDTRIVVVTDDIASAEEIDKRRGIAGDFTVFRAMGAAAAEGLDLDEVERLGSSANARTRSLGVAFSGCTMPGADEPLFSVPEGHLGLGLGIHGEPGIRDVELPTADGLAEMLVTPLLEDVPQDRGSRVGVIVNGLGTTKYEELFLLWSRIAPRLREAGLEIVDPEVGELVTSLDMGGASLTLFWLDEELERLWTSDAYTPAYRKQAAPLQGMSSAEEAADAEEREQAPESSEAGRRAAGVVQDATVRIEQLLRDNEQRLGEIDAVAGDGDHGRGMVKGISAARRAVDAAAAEGGASWTLRRGGQAWAEYAGGTSGVLWGAALESAGREIDDAADGYSEDDVRRAVRSFAESIQQLGGAHRGDKTLLDALLPFVDALCEEHAELPLQEAWTKAAVTAQEQAEATAELRPKVGRARPLAEKSVGTPDAGATSMGLILVSLGETLAQTDAPAAN